MDEFDYRKFENYKRTQHKANAYDKVDMPFLTDAERRKWKRLLKEDRGEEE